MSELSTDKIRQFSLQLAVASADAIVAINRRSELVFFNDAAEDLFGYERSEVIGHRLEMLLPEAARAAHAGHIQRFLEADAASRFMGDRMSQIIGQHANGEMVPLGASIMRIDLDEEPIMVAILRDVGEHVELQERLWRIATADALTGILNRRGFVIAAEKEWERAARYQAPIGILFFDLDRFKQINDRFGHHMGDKIICDFANLLRFTLSEDAIFGRWGGEEFVALLPNKDRHEAGAVGEKIRRAFFEQNQRSAPGESVKASVSVGASDNQRSAADLMTALRDADAAMYQAKSDGRNRVVIAEDERAA